MSSNVKNLVFLPNELIENILLRLSPNHLANLKLTCKHLKLLIESPQFVDYYHKQAEVTNNTSQLVSFMTVEYVMYSIELEKLLVGRAPNIEKYHAPKNMYSMNSMFRTVGSCNGLLCFTDSDTILLYNPSTQADNTFRCPHTPGPYVPKPTLYGFGYDSSTYDYKVVRIVWGSKGSRVDVYSLNKKVWKRLQDFPKVLVKEDISSPSYSVFLNNKLHWPVQIKFKESAYSRRVLCFDLCSEELSFLALHRELELPNQNVVLDVLDGCLSALIRRGSGDALDIWVMKKYGMKKSWTKLVTVQSDFTELVKLIALSKDGSKLFLAKSIIYTDGGAMVYCYDIDSSEMIWVFRMQFADEWVCMMQITLQSRLTFPLDELNQVKKRGNRRL